MVADPVSLPYIYIGDLTHNRQLGPARLTLHQCWPPKHWSSTALRSPLGARPRSLVSNARPGLTIAATSYLVATWSLGDHMTTTIFKDLFYLLNISLN